MPKADTVRGLTEKQRQVVIDTCRGLNQKEVAYHQGISTQAVHSLWKKVKHNTGAVSTEQAVVLLLKDGLLVLEELDGA